MIAPDGSGLTQVTQGAEEKHHPAVSPDGTGIAYVNNSGQILIQKDDTSEKISDLPLNANYPCWTPDGRKIAFMAFTFRGNQENSNLWIANLAKNRTHLLLKQAGILKNPVFHPSGTMLVYSLAYRGKFNELIEDIWRVNSDGKYPQRLIYNGVRNVQPDISPNGKWLVFASDRTGNMEIWTARLDGSRQRQLTRHRAYDAQPAWSPDGGKIAFVSSRSGQLEIWIMDRNGGNLNQMTKFDVTIDSKDPDWTEFIFSK